MPKVLNELIKYENSMEIRNKICQILEENKGKALVLDEIEFILMREYNLGINIGGKLFLYTILRDLVNQNKIESIISKGQEYFYIENKHA